MNGLRVGYCRVSSRSAEQTSSIEAQAARLREAGCDRVLIDHGVSGFRTDGRNGTAFPELIELILSGAASEVIVPHFDRTQRRVKWGIELLDALEHAKIRLLELATGTWIDPANNPSDVLLAQIRSAVQENESRVRSLKVRNALSSMRKSGKYASGKLPFGYGVVAGVIDRHPEHWAQAQQRWQQLEEQQFNVSAWLYASGSGMTSRGVRCWLANPLLRGIAPEGYGLPVPALISEAQWQDAQRAIEVRRFARGVTRSRQVRLFTGLVRCEGCSHNLHSVHERRQQKRGIWRLKCLWRTCPWFGRGIRQDVVRARVITALAAHHQELAAVAFDPASVEPTEDELALRADVERLEALAHLDGIEPLLLAAREKLHRLRVSEEGAADALTAYSLQKLDGLFADPATLDLATDEELRVVLIEFVASISWPGGWDDVVVKLRTGRPGPAPLGLGHTLPARAEGG